MCSKIDNSDCKVTVSRVEEKNIENSDEATISSDLWFGTVIPFELGKAMAEKWSLKENPA